MSLTDAMQEAYAANDHSYVIIETIQLDHITFDSPVRLARNIDEDIMLPLTSGGGAVLFTALPFSAILPGQGPEGPSAMSLKISDVNGALTPYLELAVQSTTPIEITYRSYTTADLSEPGDVIDGLFLNEVQQTAEGVTGSINFQEIELQAFPLATYDEEYYPTLQSSQG